MLPKVCVFGASGFLGQHLLKKMIDIGFDVVAYCRTPVYFERVKWIKGDILDFEQTKYATKGCNIIIHMASMTAYTSIESNPILALENYLRGSLNVIQAFEQTGAETFIYISSGKVYGKAKFIPISEEHPLEPTTLMGKLKLEVERILNLYSNYWKQRRVSVLRVFNVYGPGQGNMFLIPKILNHMAIGEVSLGDISIKRDYVFIDDVIEAILKTIENSPIGYQVYNVGSGKAISVGDIVEIIGQIYGKKIKIKTDKNQIRLEEGLIEQSCITKIKKIGWIPSTEFYCGMEKTIDYFKRHENTVKIV